MNRDQFIAAVQDPTVLGASSAAELEALVEAFPYCASTRVLLAKVLHESGSIHYDKHLRLAAVHAGDREQLYHHVMRPSVQAAIEAVKLDAPPAAVALPEVELEVPSADSTFDFDLPAADSAAETEELEPTPAEVPTVDLAELNSSAPTVAPEIEEKQETRVEQDADAHTPRKPIDPLEAEILRGVISASLSQEIEAELAAGPEPEAQKATSDPVIESKTDAPTTPRPPTQRPTSFTGWLRVLSDEPAAPEPTKEKDDVEQSSPTSLVDQFLSGSPSDVPAKAEFFSPTNVARLSLTEDKTLVTETLAKIYQQQGYYEKALEAYRQLSLANPEKSAFFATRIAELKRLLKK